MDFYNLAYAVTGDSLILVFSMWNKFMVYNLYAKIWFVIK